jgi:DDE superfamily endonuclease
MGQSTCSVCWTSQLEKSPVNAITDAAEELLAFMKTVAAKYVDRELHVVVDNLGTHFTTEVRDWLTDNPDITLHRTPVGASWINQI